MRIVFNEKSLIIGTNVPIDPNIIITYSVLFSYYLE